MPRFQINSMTAMGTGSNSTVAAESHLAAARRWAHGVWPSLSGFTLEDTGKRFEGWHYIRKTYKGESETIRIKQL